MNSCDLWGHTGWTLQGAAPGSLLYAFQNFQDENKNNRMSVTPRLTPPLVPRGHTANPGTHHRPFVLAGRKVRAGPPRCNQTPPDQPGADREAGGPSRGRRGLLEEKGSEEGSGRGTGLRPKEALGPGQQGRGHGGGQQSRAEAGRPRTGGRCTAPPQWGVPAQEVPAAPGWAQAGLCPAPRTAAHLGLTAQHLLPGILVKARS